MRAAQLRKRAAESGVSAEAMDEAEEADDVKAALVEVLVARHREVGAAGRMVTTLKGGGNAAVELVASVLEHAASVLDGVSLTTPRKGRKALLEVVERVEALMESLDAEWVDGVSKCGKKDLDVLGTLLAQGADGSNVDIAAHTVEMLECLDRCGSVVVQSMAVLGRGGAGGVSEPLHRFQRPCSTYHRARQTVHL